MSKAQIYDLKTNESQLSQGKPYGDLMYQQISSTRQVGGDDASGNPYWIKGNIEFRFEIGSNQWFDPSKTFLRVDVNLTKAGGAQLDGATPDVAPVMDTCAVLFDRIELFINEKSIEVLESGSIDVVDIVKRRLDRTFDWLNSGPGQSNNNYASQFDVRKNVYNVATNTEAGTGQTLTWKLPLSLFDGVLNKSYMPVGRYMIRCSPHTEYRKRAVQSLVADRSPVTDYKFSITNAELFVPIVTGIRLSDMIYLLDLEKYNVQKTTVANNTSLQKITFQVPPSTFKCAVFFQAANAGANTLTPATNFITDSPSNPATNYQKFVESLYVDFKGLIKPAPQVIESFAVNGFQGDGYRYEYTYANSDNENPESRTDYELRGNMLFIDWSADSSNKATGMTVFCKFSTAPGTNTNLCVMTWSRAVSRIQIQDSAVINVSTEDH